MHYSFDYHQRNGTVGTYEKLVVFASKRFDEYTTIILYGLYSLDEVTMELCLAMHDDLLTDAYLINNILMYTDEMERTGDYGLQTIRWVGDQLQSIFEWCECMGFAQVQMWPADKKIRRALLAHSRRTNDYKLEYIDGLGISTVDFFDEEAMFADRSLICNECFRSRKLKFF